MKYAKFAIALLGAGVTLAAQNNIILPAILAQIAPIASAILVYIVPNKQ